MHRTRKIISVIGKLLLKRYVFSLKFNIYYSITINIEYYQPVWRRDHLRPVNKLVPRDVLLFHCAILLIQLYIHNWSVSRLFSQSISRSVRYSISCSIKLILKIQVCYITRCSCLWNGKEYFAISP